MNGMVPCCDCKRLRMGCVCTGSHGISEEAEDLCIKITSSFWQIYAVHCREDRIEIETGLDDVCKVVFNDMVVMTAGAIGGWCFAVQIIVEVYRKLEVAAWVACREAEAFGREFEHNQAV